MQYVVVDFVRSNEFEASCGTCSFFLMSFSCFVLHPLPPTSLPVCMVASVLLVGPALLLFLYHSICKRNAMRLYALKSQEWHLVLMRRTRKVCLVARRNHQLVHLHVRVVCSLFHVCCPPFPCLSPLSILIKLLLF